MSAPASQGPFNGRTGGRLHPGKVAERSAIGKSAAVALGLFAVLTGFHVGEARADPPGAARLEVVVQKALGIFLALPDRRERGEGLSLDDHGELEIRFQRSLPPTKRDAFLCQGIRWVLLGRLDKATGIGALFRSLPDVKSVVLVFYELETRLKADADGGYAQSRRAVPSARFRISREKALTLDPNAMERLLGPETCLSNGRNLLDLLWAPETIQAP